jgi:antitoxin VapB
MDSLQWFCLLFIVDIPGGVAYAEVYARISRGAEMYTQRHVSLFRNGRNQALRIPRAFELDAKEAIIYKDGDRLIIEPVKKRGLLELLSSWEVLAEDFPEMDDPLIEEEVIF